MIPAADLVDLIAHVRARFGLAKDAEITVEANPGPDERGDTAAMVAAGVTRLSLGAQSMADATLTRLGRRHRVRHVAQAVGCRARGRHPVDQPRPPLRRARRIARRLDDDAGRGPRTGAGPPVAVRPVPRRSGRRGADGRGDRRPPADDAGARRWRETARPLQDEDRAAAEYHHAVHRLADDGWHGYEISNWARPGHESRHNLAYWERRPYEAVGPGRPRLRWRHAALERRPARWLSGRADARRRLARRRCRPAARRSWTRPTAAAERVILGLRTAQGIPVDGGPRAAPGRQLRLGHLRGTRGRDRGRPDRPDDPRPPALERALLATRRLGAWRRATGPLPVGRPFRSRCKGPDGRISR